MLINVFADAHGMEFNSVHGKEGDTIEQAVGKRDWNNTIILCNGLQVDKSHVLKESDIVCVRTFPSAVVAALVAPIGIGIGVDALVNKLTGKHIGQHLADGIKWLTSWVKEDTTNKSSEEDKTIPSMRGAKNSSGFGKPIPLVIGRSLYTPMYVGNPYTMIGGTDGEDQYFYALYMLGYNDITVRDVKLDNHLLTEDASVVDSDGYCVLNADLPAKYKNNIKIEIKDNDNGELRLYDQKVVQADKSVEIAYPEGITEANRCIDDFSAINPQIVEIEFSLPSLYSYSGSTLSDASVSVGISISFDKGQTYVPFEQITGSNSYAVEGSLGVSTITRSKNKAMRFVARHELTYAQAMSCVNNGDGVAFIHIVRTSVQSTDSQTSDKITLSAIRTWCFDRTATKEYATEHPSKPVLIAQRPVDSKTCAITKRLAVKIKATDELNGQLDSLNMILTSKCRTWNSTTGEWSAENELAETSNPAAVALRVMQSPMLGTHAYNDTKEKIDLEAFGELYEWCNNQTYVDESGVSHAFQFTCGTVLTTRKKLSDIVDTILGTCKALRVLNGTKYSVLIDKPRTVPVTVLNNHNILSDGLENTKSFDELPDGYKVKFVDKDNGYDEGEFYCMFDGKSHEDPEAVIESIELPLVTDYRQAWKLARYELAKRKLRPEVWTRKVGVEGNLIEVGNLVTIQDDTILVGIGDGGEIKSVEVEDNSIVAIETDSYFNVSDLTKTYAVKISHFTVEGGFEVIVRKVVFTTAGRYNRLVFETPFSSSSTSVPVVGDFVSFGVYGQETIDALCFGKKDSGDGKTLLTLVPYSDGVYTADSSPIPEYDAKITAIQSLAGVKEVPIENVSKSEVAEIVNDAVSSLPGGDTTPPSVPSITSAVSNASGNINIVFSKSVDTGSGVMEYHVQSYNATTQKWSVVGTVLHDASVVENTYTYETPVKSASGVSYTIAVSAVDKAGNESERSTASTVSAVVTTRPVAPTNFSAVAKRDSIDVSWTPVPSTDSALACTHYVLHLSRDGGENWTDINVYGNSYSYMFDRTVDGYPESDTLEDDYIVKLTGVSVYGLNTATDLQTVPDTTSYGTWNFVAPTVTMTPQEDYLSIAWTGAVPTDFYGNISYSVKLNGTVIKSGTKSLSCIYMFDRTTDGYPELSAIRNYTVELVAKSEGCTRTVTTFTVDGSYYKTWGIATPVITAKALEKQIVITLPKDTASYGEKTFDIYVDNTLVASDVKTDSYVYAINPMSKSAVQALSIYAKEKSVAGYTNSASVTPNVTDYKGYTPVVPTLTATSSGRSINLRWSAQDIYGDDGVYLQVAKAYKLVDGEYTPIVNESELVWYAPALGLNPYESEDNYKQGEVGGKLQVKSNLSVSFSVPLYGQTNSESINTLYAYRIQAKSTLETSQWSAVTYIEAKATNAQDVVKAWKLENGEKVKLDGALGVKQIFVEELAALSANLGYITDGAMQGDQYNYWAVNDTLVGNTLMRKGSFRVGGEHQYIQVTPKVEGGVATGEYDIDFVINDFTVSASGETSVNGNSFTVYDEDGDIMFQTSNDGNLIMVEEGTYVSGAPKSVISYNDSNNIPLRASFTYTENNAELYTVLWCNEYKELRVYKNDILRASYSNTDETSKYNPVPYLRNLVSRTDYVILGYKYDSSTQVSTMIAYDYSTNDFVTVTHNGEITPVVQIHNKILCSRGNGELIIWNYLSDSVTVVNIDSSISSGNPYCFAFLVDHENFYFCGNFGLLSVISKISMDGSCVYCFIHFTVARITVARTFPVCYSNFYENGFAFTGLFDVIETSQSHSTRYGTAVLQNVVWNNSIDNDPIYTPFDFYAMDGGKFLDYLIEQLNNSSEEIDVIDVIDLNFNIPVGGNSLESMPVISTVLTSAQGSSEFIIDKDFSVTAIKGLVDNETPEIHEYYTLKGTVELYPSVKIDRRFWFMGFINIFAEDILRFSIEGYVVLNSISKKSYIPLFNTVYGSTVGDFSPSFELLEINFAPHDTVTGRNTYGTGIGFTKILYDEESGRYKYILDSGAELEFNEYGKLVVDSSQGMKGERGVGVQDVTEVESSEDGGRNEITFTMTDLTTHKVYVKNGTKGSTGLTPQITVQGGSHVGEVGTPTVTQSGTAEAPVITLDYLKGATGTGGETAEKLATARTLTVSDSDGTHTGAGTSFDGSANADIKLPSTIKADIEGDVTGDLTGDVTGNVTGNADTATKLKTARSISISDSDGTNTGTGVNFDGSGNATLKLPSTIKASLSGNASTATKSNNATALSNAVTCSTAAGTTAKTVTLSGFTLHKGARFLLYLQNTNTAYAPTLNVNGTGAKTVYINGGSSVTTSNWTSGYWNCVYDGTYWRLDSTGDAYYARRAAQDESGNNIKDKYGSTLSLSGTSLKLLDANGNANSSLTLDRSNVGLGSVDNTADLAKTVLKAAGLGVYTCSTAAATVAKTLALSNFALYTGARLYIIFSNENTASAPTLNVNSTGAKPIKLGSNSSPGTSDLTWANPASGSTVSSAWNKIKANTIYEAYYDGTNWILSAMNGPSMGVKGYYFSTSKSYIKFTNGLIIQWYKVQGSGSSATTKSFTWPLTFTSSTSYVVSATPWANSTDQASLQYFLYDKTESTIKYMSLTSVGYQEFIAIGY